MTPPALPRAVALLALLLASTALADPGLPKSTTWLGAGILLSASQRPSGGMTGFGVEASLHLFRDSEFTSGFGVFGQWQATSEENNRICGGFQGTYQFFGVELGVAHETGNRDFAGTTSLHVAPFVSAAGVAALGLRLGIPIAHSDGPKPGYGVDVGVVFSLKFPLGLG